MRGRAGAALLRSAQAATAAAQVPSCATAAGLRLTHLGVSGTRSLPLITFHVSYTTRLYMEAKAWLPTRGQPKV
jgi:hypothetical protein